MRHLAAAVALLVLVPACDDPTDAPPEPDAFVVIDGYEMTSTTDEVWRLTLHEVRDGCGRYNGGPDNYEVLRVVNSAAGPVLHLGQQPFECVEVDGDHVCEIVTRDFDDGVNARMAWTFEIDGAPSSSMTGQLSIDVTSPGDMSSSICRIEAEAQARPLEVAPLEGVSCELGADLHALQTRAPSLVDFVNETDGIVTILELDGEGVPVPRTRVLPGERLPWMGEVATPIMVESPESGCVDVYLPQGPAHEVRVR